MTTVVDKPQTSDPRTSRRRRRSGRRAEPTRSGFPWWAVGTWIVTLIFFLPVAWMVLTSFHHEADAATNPPSVFAAVTYAAEACRAAHS